MYWWDGYGFMVDKDVECVRIEDDLIFVGVNFFLIVGGFILVNLIKVDYVGMWFGVIVN